MFREKGETMWTSVREECAASGSAGGSHIVFFTVEFGGEVFVGCYDGVVLDGVCCHVWDDGGHFLDG